MTDKKAFTVLLIVGMSGITCCCDYGAYTSYTAVLHTLVAGLLARSQYLEGPATGHLGTGFSWFRCD